MSATKIQTDRETELRFTAEVCVDLFSGKSVVWIQNQKAPGERKMRFYLVPDEGETFESVAQKIRPAIEAHDGRTP